MLGHWILTCDSCANHSEKCIYLPSQTLLQSTNLLSEFSHECSLASSVLHVFLHQFVEGPPGISEASRFGVSEVFKYSALDHLKETFQRHIILRKALAYKVIWKFICKDYLDNFMLFTFLSFSTQFSYFLTEKLIVFSPIIAYLCWTSQYRRFLT